ncbi:MAG: SpoIIE family protein phosphatase [Thermacetogeniaceae bacterium]|jgi:stage II sporulation protein E|nr:SpoIIE family protein phosphatase [Syntrophomonadaceae bacterium]
MAVVFSKLRYLTLGIQAIKTEPVWHICLFLMGLAAGRGVLGGLAPFAPPLALTGALCCGRLFLLSLIGIFAGIAFRPPVFTDIAIAVDYLVVITAVFAGRKLKKQLKEYWYTAVLLTGGINFGIKYIYLLISGAQTGFLPGLLSESMLAGIFTVPLYYLFSDYKKQKGLFFILVFVLVYCGLGDLRLGPAKIEDIMSRSVLLMAAGGWGSGSAAAVGVLLGMLSGNPAVALPRTGFFAATGFFSGLLRNWGPAGVILGFFLSVLLFSASFNRQIHFQEHFLSSMMAVVVYLAAWRHLPFFPKREGQDSYSCEPIHAEVGFAQRSKPGEALCGDSMGVAHLSDRRMLLSVSDGMGAGVNAARESRIVVKLIEQLVESGVSPQKAAGIVNTALYLRGGEESAATIDAAIIDLNAGHAEFLKVGAPPSYLKRGEAVEVIRSSCWPAGILDELDAQVLAREIQSGDILIMATDGVTEANFDGKEADDWLYSYLQELPMEEAQLIADLILKYALKTAGFKNRDDMTVLVARFEREQGLE